MLLRNTPSNFPFQTSIARSASRLRCTPPSLLALACAAALAMPLSAAAQQESTNQDPPEATTLDTVTVTGIRASIATSVETKQESSSIVEAVSAEDIGRLPDISIADSISRLDHAARRWTRPGNPYPRHVRAVRRHAAQWT